MALINWHSLSAKDVLAGLNASENGLTEEEAEKRRAEYGFNELKEEKKKTSLQLFVSQFLNILIIILIVAALISALLGEVVDASAIIAIVVLNAIFGFYQEYKAEKAIEALKKMVAPQTRVLRRDSAESLPAEKRTHSRNLVPGDIIVLEAGDKVPADARLIESSRLEVEEASLTGESVPVGKNAETICPEDAVISEQGNMLFMGTSAVNGRAKAVVVKTGMSTEMGGIANLVQEVREDKTPLQKRLEALGKQLGIIFVMLCGIIFLLGVLRRIELIEMFLVSVSLAVAAIPEALPAVVTITLAIGVQRMAKRNAIIRRLPAVETLGCSTVICTDKTGTLTKNEMTVKKIFCNGTTLSVSGSGFELSGSFISEKTGKRIMPDERHIQMVMRISILCNNASMRVQGERVEVTGDPTESALLVVAGKAGKSKEELSREYKFLDELSFDPSRKMMSVIYQKGAEKHAFTKGAPEMLLEKCDRIMKNGKEVELTRREKELIGKETERMASDALRVLGFAYRRLPEKLKGYSIDSVEEKLVFVGLAGIYDPPREEVKDAIVICRDAGIKVVMITGDNEKTANAIGREIGLVEGDSRVLMGKEINGMTDEALEEVVKNVRLFARVSPEHKLRIVQAFRKNGEVVAVTGDGVNDAPALKRSDIGVAMGISGTDVAKEASDMVLADDNFASIVNAVEEGRVIYDNIAKSVRYLLACNIGELLTIFSAMLFYLPIPLVPIQILWMNLVTDSLPALALGVDPADKEVMKKKPRSQKEEMLGKEVLFSLFFAGLVMCISTLAVYLFYLHYDETKAVTTAFTTLILIQMFIALYSRSESKSSIETGFFSNKFLLFSVLSAVFLQAAVIYVPFLQQIFKTVPLSVGDWAAVLAVSTGVFIMLEAKKKFFK
ncbi:calcium-transporting P-type ATPase, PMR1-type [Candidatus Micrarchaeota archaeon]|nr:calcium-transporting P-type ATPase, PMR1-type [Candidatus Micrarchaeota archaeon]